ncbi:hypothetical protein K431DRAFT_289543 [Polychaeton citri CBS 116435]|uniref:F-box domain-containing protein n=1 Tax=Polychaeton citri CBS 116435 TaxID=1314669 RepID=A0A9P4PYQ1_9PEZI|nr:hypothetical protein K431DRAFT_289543 [Polychaeton citri CBS 116435]
MDRLPDEVILHVLSFLDPVDLVHLQSVSSRCLTLARDNNLWRAECFIHSAAEALRRCNQLLGAQDGRLTELRNAVTALPGGSLTAWDDFRLRGGPQPRVSANPEAKARTQTTRALANWDPGYPSEHLDYYEEFVRRHADIEVGWLTLPGANQSDGGEYREATGLSILKDQQAPLKTHIVSPLDDGSICLWDITDRSTDRAGGCGSLVSQSRPGLLTGRPVDSTFENHAIMTDTGSVECVSIDQTSRKGYFAVKTLLHEVDLSTFQLIGSRQYPFPITALSATSPQSPLSVGTNHTVHLHDPRDPAFMGPSEGNRGELIGGTVYSHGQLSQPGPLCILNDDGVDGTDSSIWVAGRFTSLLNYDRRFFPRLRGTIHSGARIASLSSLPYPLIPRSLDLVRNPGTSLGTLQEAKKAAGTTIIAAAEYKGKGSLELYGMPNMHTYQNRQTASASKLLSAVPHGGQIVFSDGDGNLKWIERDGFTVVRNYNINDSVSKGKTGPSTPDSGLGGIWLSSMDVPGQNDIVQKLLPIAPPPSLPYGGRWDVNQSDLLMWTGDGRIGMLGHGSRDPLLARNEEWHDTLEEQAQTAEELAKQDAERQYGMAMRRALQRNADEVRFVRGLGMAV